jgi:hypothetical protein
MTGREGVTYVPAMVRGRNSAWLLEDIHERGVEGANSLWFLFPRSGLLPASRHLHLPSRNAGAENSFSGPELHGVSLGVGRVGRASQQSQHLGENVAAPSKIQKEGRAHQSQPRTAAHSSTQHRLGMNREWASQGSLTSVRYSPVPCS